MWWTQKDTICCEVLAQKLRTVSQLLRDNGTLALTEDDKGWILAQLERVETSLLTEFHKWASPAEMRQQSHSAAIRALDEEMKSLVDR